MRSRKKKTRRTDAPLVGITPDTAKNPAGAPALFVLHERYARALSEAGAAPLILPIDCSAFFLRRIADHLDGILVSGGNFDIHPRLYGEESLPELGEINHERTRFEMAVISLALKKNIPLLGICGGAQAINVALGGSLYQDIAAQLPDAAEHQQGSLKEKGGHKITIRDGTRLRAIVGRAALEVNTTHHQAVKKTGAGLAVNATAEDGVIEGIESREHSFVLGVQWHPEFLTERDMCQRQIFAAFTRACRERRI